MCDLNTFKIALNINNYCNYNCSYCMASTANTINKIDMDYIYIKLLLNRLDKYLPDYKIVYDILGGEPLLHKRCIDILTTLLNHKSTNEVRLLTNGTINMQKLPVRNDYKVLVSFHYETMCNLDYNKQYNIIYNNVECLLKNKIKCRVHILRTRKMTDEIVKNIADDFNNLAHKYNTKDIVSTDIVFYFDGKDTDYKKPKSKLVYTNRAIGVTPYFDAQYSCKMLSLQHFMLMTLLSNNTWSTIKHNIDNIQKCTYNKCTCIRCFPVQLYR